MPDEPRVPQCSSYQWQQVPADVYLRPAGLCHVICQFIRRCKEKQEIKKPGNQETGKSRNREIKRNQRKPKIKESK
jgi:hypothetical protein